ncbi:SMI1/KNR4 family protein [Streptomyces sp. NPDC050085]|uniref:SMI1/KNR4 family protein n=1 Tax=Streptomyces sp. NPDC050085 TaxID=3365600 RepID=UPI003791823B
MDALVRPVVEAIVAEGPDGWTDAVLHARAGRGGISLRGGYSARGVRLTRALLPNPFAEVGRLGQVLGSAYGWEPVSFELRCTPSGAYRFVAFDDTVTYENGVRGGGFQVVLDPAYRLPQPGEWQEAGTAGPAGDPGLAVARMRELLARRAALLGHYLELLDQGAYELEETDAQGGGGGRLWLRERHPESQEASAVQQIVGDIPDEVPATLQAIHINNQSEPVDLAPLAAAPALRLLHLNRSTALGLTPVRALPVESLRVTLADGDLSALEGHPHLAALDVTCAAPMDVAVLRTLPELRGLDLSDADARRLPALGELSGLRYLALGAAQWAELLDEGKAPAGLAAAKLAGADVTFEEALRWAARLGQDTGGALVVVSGD